MFDPMLFSFYLFWILHIHYYYYEYDRSYYFFRLYEMVGKYYIVFEGRKPNIYNIWDEAKLKVLGYRGAQHRMYKDLRDA